MLPLDPGKLNIKLEGAVGWGGRGPAKRARLAASFYFFQQAAGKRGQEDTACCKVSPGERRRWKVEIIFLSFSLGRNTINLRGRIKF